LPDILQSLKANHQSGTLHLHDGKKLFALFFEKDSITCVHPGKPSRDYLPEIICLFLGISDERMDREFKKKLKLSIAQRLHKSRIAGAAKINGLHRVYLTEFLHDVFAWQSGSFRFEDGQAPDEPFDDDQRDAGLKLDVDQVLFESMRRADEWKIISKQIPTMDDVLVVTDESRPKTEALDEPVKTIFRYCNGENSVKEIAYRSGQDLFTTARILGGALERLMVRRVAPNDLIVLAEKAFSDKKTNEALRYFKRAIELDRGNTDARRRFADLCLEMGVKDEATNEYKTLAQLAREKQDYERAKSLYRRIIAVNPSEYEFQKRLYEMLREIKDPEAESCGLGLSETLKRLGLRNEEVQVLHQLIEDHAENAVLYERLGDAEQALGHQKNATEHFVAAAELSIRSNDLQRACANYEHVLAINPGDAKAQKRLDDLQSGLFLKKRQRRRKIILIAELCTAFLLAFAYVTYLAVSTVNYLDLRNRHLLYGAQGDFPRIQDELLAFERKFPYSLITMDVRRYRLAVERIRIGVRPAAGGMYCDTAKAPIIASEITQLHAEYGAADSVAARPR
jgi:tetratricopeptide (TPR) repeat protein